MVIVGSGELMNKLTLNININLTYECLGKHKLCDRVNAHETANAEGANAYGIVNRNAPIINSPGVLGLFDHLDLRDLRDLRNIRDIRDIEDTLIIIVLVFTDIGQGTAVHVDI